MFNPSTSSRLTVQNSMKCTPECTVLIDKIKNIPSPVASGQWRRQDLLRGAAKLEIRPWGGRYGRVKQLLDDFNFVSNAVGLY